MSGVRLSCNMFALVPIVDSTSDIYVILLLYDVDVSCHRPFLPGTSLEPAVIPTAHASSFTLQYIIIIIIIIIRYGCLLSQTFLPGTSLEPAVIPTAHASSFTLQYFPYYV